ncbi:MAG: hypothetical protein Q9M36_02990 [Sulfurovum sp.]|nr:hypothetical protein [Sulfurovum sp.]
MLKNEDYEFTIIPYAKEDSLGGDRITFTNEKEACAFIKKNKIDGMCFVFCAVDVSHATNKDNTYCDSLFSFEVTAHTELNNFQWEYMLYSSS